MSRKTTPTYVLLNQITLAATSSSVTFSNIPQNYGDLVIVANFQNSGLGSATRFQLNGDTGANYNGVWIVYYTSAGSSSETNQTSARLFGAARGPDNLFTNMAVVQFMDYSASDKHKTVISRFDSANADVQATVSRWASTAPVTSINLLDILGQTYSVGSSFYLYGLVA